MDAFDMAMQNTERLLDKLLQSEKIAISSVSLNFSQGVYAFFEGDKPVYIGRINNLKNRLAQHRRRSSTHDQASFAFRIACEETKKLGLEFNSSNRKELALHKDFSSYFYSAKERVAAMRVCAIETNDPVEQAIFEIYAAVKLRTEYNTFQTH